MDAEGAEDVRQRMRTAKSYGPDTSKVGVKLAEATPPATVSTKPDHRGEYEATVNHCVRSAGCSGVSVKTAPVFFLLGVGGCGCIKRPAFPRPLA